MPLYAAHPSEWIMEPGAICSWISGSSLAAERSLSTICRKPRRVSLHTAPKTHLGSSGTRPTLFLRQEIRLSSISTTSPGPPIW